MRKKKHKFYKVIEHTADLGVIVCGEDLKRLFSNSALTLMDLMVSVESTGKTTEHRISLSAEDIPDLMVRWLGEILYLFSGESLLVTGLHITELSAVGMQAVLSVAPLDGSRYETVHDIKAVTYHQIDVVQKGGLWEARVFFDL